jgi:transglutaminase-like putative cysteine protease
MNRRSFLRSAGAVSATLVLPRSPRLLALAGDRDHWRTFEVTTRVEVLKPVGTTLVWLPAALIRDMPFQKTLSNDFKAEGGSVELVEDRADAVGIVSAKFPDGVNSVLTLTCRVATRPYAVDLAAPGRAPKASAAELEYYLQPTKFVPIDGVVKAQAAECTRGATTDLEKARAIYDWICDNTFRNPKTRGCGLGDIRFMLESKDLGGKCADINALYVGLARAAGLPARHVYGLRVAKSDLGYKSLGPATEVCTKGQHCRTEVYLEGYGWVPVDPADVRKVVLEEPPGNLPLDDEMVKRARARLFGSWEMNWMAYNLGHDVVLPGSKGAPVIYFMYPQGETAEGRIDPFDPDAFKYAITSKELAPANS